MWFWESFSPLFYYLFHLRLSAVDCWLWSNRNYLLFCNLSHKIMKCSLLSRSRAMNGTWSTPSHPFQKNVKCWCFSAQNDKEEKTNLDSSKKTWRVPHNYTFVNNDSCILFDFAPNFRATHSNAQCGVTSMNRWTKESRWMMQQKKPCKLRIYRNVATAQHSSKLLKTSTKTTIKYKKNVNAKEEAKFKSNWRKKKHNKKQYSLCRMSMPNTESRSTWMYRVQCVYRMCAKERKIQSANCQSI